MTGCELLQAGRRPRRRLVTWPARNQDLIDGDTRRAAQGRDFSKAYMPELAMAANDAKSEGAVPVGRINLRQEPTDAGAGNEQLHDRKEIGPPSKITAFLGVPQSNGVTLRR